MARILRVTGPNSRPIITDFPDDAPDGDTPLEIRTKHITEVETFTFLGFILAHELALLDTSAKPVTAFINVEVPTFKEKLTYFQTKPLTNEQLADELNDIGLNWEHFLANTNDKLIPSSPTKITDTVFQEKIDALDILTEGLVREINTRSIASKGKLL